MSTLTDAATTYSLATNTKGIPQISPDSAVGINKSLIGLNRTELETALGAIGVPKNQLKMRAAQLWNWIYVHGAVDFHQMKNISGELREKLTRSFTIDRPEIVTELISVDGTIKWLLKFPSSGKTPPVEIESVYIPEEGRGTLCVSSQVGCSLTCTFCHTGTQRLVRNLTSGEIVSQILVALDKIGDYVGNKKSGSETQPTEGRSISNIVMMGMGEPLFNFGNVKQALSIVSDSAGIALSKRRITLSTSGVVPMIARTGSEIGCKLAISLHAVRDELRNVLVPVNKKWNINDLLDACRKYPSVSNAKRITFEYVMLKNVNDSLADARELVRLLRGIPAKINLIPFNPWPGSQYECSDWDQIERFAEIINDAGYASPIRVPRGRDIFAACGQLKSETQRLGRPNSRV